MPIYQAIVLGLIQGVTEFLPVSSSGHLIIIPWLLNWKDPGLTFDVALHAGTLVAVLIYFAPTWMRILRGALGGGDAANRVVLAPVERKEEVLVAANQGGASVAVRTSTYLEAAPGEQGGRWLLWFILLATVPGAIVGALLEKRAETSLRAPVLIAGTMIGVGLLMWLAEYMGSQRKRLEQVSLFDSILVGMAQACAIVPGVSRSGSTIAVGLFRGLSRDAAARFSFLLSTPIIAGAVLLKAHHMLKEPLAHDMWAPFLAGFVVSAIVGYAAIAIFIGYLRTHSLKLFVVYRVVFGIIVLALAYRGLFR
ncbi:MAG: undecaprenyl-diphosphate phosphatase [Acidobacteria bacterium]|nr:undecaprenyl-diphosphate phosphatase [Acidobacteriota bacterium]